VALIKAHLIMTLTLTAFLSLTTIDVYAGTGDRGGGGNSAKPSAINEVEIINNLSSDVKRVAFYFLNYLKYSLTYSSTINVSLPYYSGPKHIPKSDDNDYQNQIKYKKLFTVQPNIFDVLSNLKVIEVHKDSFCYDKNNQPVDSTFYNTKTPDALCLSTKRLVSEWNIVDFQIRSVALIIHEIFHRLVRSVGADALGINKEDEELEAQRLENLVIKSLARENLDGFMLNLSFWGITAANLRNSITGLSLLPYGEKSYTVLKGIDKSFTKLYQMSGMVESWKLSSHLHALSTQWYKIFMGISNKISILEIWHNGRSQTGVEVDFDTLFGIDKSIDMCEYEKRINDSDLEFCETVVTIDKVILDLLKVDKIDRQAGKVNKKLELEYNKLIKLIDLATKEVYLAPSHALIPEKFSIVSID